MKMLAVISESIIIDKLLDEFHERKGDGVEYEGAYYLTNLNTDSTLAILSDVRNESGLLYSKTSLNKLVPFEPDLSLFENATKQLPELDDSIEEILKEYDSTLHFQEVSTIPPSGTDVDKELIELFVRTRYLLGAGNLCYAQAALYKDDEYFTIVSSPNCPYYIDSIRVKI